MRIGPRLAGLLPLVLVACDSGTNVQEDVTASRALMRPAVPVPPGAVPKGSVQRNARLAGPAPEPAEAVLARGRERFLVFCSPCHGSSGRGDGLVTRHGFPPPPSYHQDRLRDAPPSHMVAVITGGFGRMGSYADRVPAEDRWAIALYIKALQADPRRAEAPGSTGVPPAEAPP